MTIAYLADRIEILESTLRIELPEGARVGQKFTFIGEVTIVGVEAERVEIGDGQWLPGQKTTRMLITKIELKPEDDA